MKRSSGKKFPDNFKGRQHQDYNELFEMIESGMEDYEIAQEIGASSNYVSDIKKRILNDMI
ncbi:MAG: hypothetical protein ACM3ZR_00715 [Pseudomonadota bacterium]